MAVLKARENSSDSFTPVSMIGVGNASQSQRGLMTAQDKVKLDTLVNLLVPVGVILTFANDINPNDIYQGTTWQKIEGRFLLGSSSAYALGSTGGSADAVVVQHSHDFGNAFTNRTIPNDGSHVGQYNIPILNSNTSVQSGTRSAGIDGTGKNMPPYEVVNYWKRTA